MAKGKVIEVEEDGTPYDAVCIHGVHFGGYNCIICHPEKEAALAWLFSPEMSSLIPTAPDAVCSCYHDEEHGYFQNLACPVHGTMPRR